MLEMAYPAELVGEARRLTHPDTAERAGLAAVVVDVPQALGIPAVKVASVVVVVAVVTAAAPQAAVASAVVAVVVE